MTFTKIAWDKDIPYLNNEDDITKASDLIIVDYNQLIATSLKLILEQSNIKDEYNNMGIYYPIASKDGSNNYFIFITKNTQTTVLINEDIQKIKEISISSNANNNTTQIDLSKINLKKLDIKFLKNEVLGEGQLLSIKKIYQSNHNPNIQIIFSKEYDNQLQYSEKMKFDYDVKHIEKLELFDSINIINEKSLP